MKKFTNFTKKTFGKIALKISAVTTLIPASITSAKCASDPGGAVTAVANVIVDIFPYIGTFFILSGVFKLIQAYRTDQPENQASAAKDIVIGAVFLAFKIFVWNKISGSILPGGGGGAAAGTT